MIDQTVSFFLQATPVLISLIFAASVIAISIWLDADAYNQPRR